MLKGEDLRRHNERLLARIVAAGGIRGAQQEPSLDSTGNTGGLIGVSKNYKPPARSVLAANPFGRVDVQPIARYKQGDEFNLPGGMNPGNIQQIQELMLDAGLITKNTSFSFGGWNKDLANIWRDNVLGPANQRGLSAMDYLRDLINRGGQIKLKDLAGGTKGAYQVPTRELRNVDDLRDTFKMTASKVIGRNISDEEANSMIMAYRQIEINAEDARNNAAYQQANANAQGQVGQAAPVDIQQAPAPEDFANRVIREKYGGEAAATDLRNVLDNLGSMIRQNPFKQGG